MINVLNDRQIRYHSTLIDVTEEFLGLKETAGPKDHPFVVMAHQLCKVVGSKPPASTDEIPWCSSGLVAMQLITNLRLNPKLALELMRQWKVPEYLITQLREYGEIPDEMITLETGFPLPKPTFSAGAISYQSYGVEVARAAWIPGLIAGMTRDGGNHVSLFKAIAGPGPILVGMNQNNSICSADWYSWARQKTMRAVII